MAKTSIKHTRVITEKVSFKDALISEDGTNITYLVEDVETTSPISNFISLFAGKRVTFSIGEKDEEDIED